MPADYTLAAEHAKSQKKDKARLTCFVCCNAARSGKVPLCIIAKCLLPDAFNKKSSAELGFDYRAKGKAWMTKSLWFEWLHMFDSHVHSKGKQAVIIVDNCAAHGRESEVLERCLQNTKVIFLPPNKTEIMYPYDAGIITALKGRYSRKQMASVLIHMDLGCKDIY